MIMGGQTEHGFPYPTGEDRVMDGDDAIKALAEAVDAQLYAGVATGLGMWQATTGVVVCSNASLSAAPGSTVLRARHMKIGRTVWFIGEASAAQLVTSGAISLPNAVVGAPAYRFLNCGTLIVTGTGAPSNQQHVGFMHASTDRLMCVTLTNGFNDFPAGCQIRWSVAYETAT